MDRRLSAKTVMIEMDVTSLANFLRSHSTADRNDWIALNKLSLALVQALFKLIGSWTDVPYYHNEVHLQCNVRVKN